MGKKVNRRKAVKDNCGMCDEAKIDKMVLCDTCEKWFHFSCVNLTRITKSESWNCPKCTADAENRNRKDDTYQLRSRSKVHPTEEVPTEPQKRGDVNKNSQRQTTNGQQQDSLQYVTNIDIELQRIEEEKILQQKHQEERHQLEKQYLERKYDLLARQSSQNLISSLVKSTQKVISSSVKSTTTEEWINRLTNVEKDDNLKKSEQLDKSEFDMDEFFKRLDALRKPPVLNKSAEVNAKPKELSSFEKRINELRFEDMDREEKKSPYKQFQQDTDNPPKIENQNEKLIPLQPVAKVIDNWNTALPGSHILTRAQIAARQVVTKDLPIFYGKPQDWSIFHKRFLNSTALCGFSDGENIDRLQKCLKGMAYEAVQDLLLDAESVKDIISTLEKLFGRPEIIIKSLLNKIRQLPNPKAENLNSMVSFALNVRNLATTIERKGMNQYLSNPILLQELVDRLPTTYKVDWARYIAHTPDNKINLLTLNNYLQELLQALIKVTEYIPKESDKKFEKKQQKLNWEHINLHQEPGEDRNHKFEKSKENEYKCKICNQTCKSTSDCRQFKSFLPAKRWQMVYEHKLCRKCLRRHSGFCRINKECGVNNCTYKHHPLLHDDQKHNLEIQSKDVEKKIDISASHLNLSTNVLLRIIPIKIYGNGITMDTYAFLDDGSTTTLIDEKLANALNLVGPTKELCLIWSANVHRMEKNSRQVTVMISSIDNPTKQFKIREVKTVENLAIPQQRLDKDNLCKKFPHLQGVPFNSYEHGIPGILIGSNNPRIGLPRKIIEASEYEPIATKTNIGWTVHGPIGGTDCIDLITMDHYKVTECGCQHECDESLHKSMKEYFSIDNFGVQVPSALNNMSKEEEKALQQLKVLTRRRDDHFETGLLWRYDDVHLPESYHMARRRLECIENKPETVAVIDRTINDYIQKGYARKLTTEEIAKNEKHWYLPIFTVVYPKKPDKPRMVFDAAAKVKGIALNSVLLKGPDQLISLVEILSRFREKLYAVCGDIREMFPQVRIRPEDQQYQRFLWRNGDKQTEPEVYVMSVMIFGAACSPCTAHYVKNLNASEFSNEFPRATEAIIKNHYMDDMMEGENTEEELVQLVKDVKYIHSKAGFEIRNFLSNSKKVMEELGSIESLEKKNISPDKDFEIERVLGMWWNIKEDTFTFSLKFLSVTRDILSGESLPTKRELLKLLMSIFDPLGLISHYLIHLKTLIQHLWRSKLEWDERIATKELIEPWKRWLEVLPAVENVQVPRLYTPRLTNSQKSIQLHTFMDASENAFGAVSYLRVEDETGVACSLMRSKSRVAPLKYLSIPRKELQSGLLGHRLAKNIIESQTFKVDKRVFWTDSKTLLSWLRTDHRKYHQFVAHRVGEILENTNLDEWRWVPSKLNVADDLTKWPNYHIFEKTNRWFTGPSFLYDSPDKWPIQRDIEVDETMEDMRVIHAHKDITVNSFLDATRFSNWNRLVRTVAFTIRFTKILRSKIKKESVQWSHLTRDELIQAQRVIYRQAQFEGFFEEMVILELNKKRDPTEQIDIPKTSSLISCSPYLDNFGVLRVRGRIDAAKVILPETKRPIIMPRKNWITKLLIGHYHRIYHHHNHETVVNEVRQRFYIPKLRVVLKSIVTNDCQLCKNRRAKPASPEEGNLPEGRLAVGFRPFTHTGIDYFGPIKVIQGRSEVKRWGVLFTCLTVRAIHVEVSYRMTTDSCIKAIRNFTNIRGQPTEFYSDCGTNLTGTDNELQRALKEVDINVLATKFTTSYSRWNFNPPETKHMGGVWERLVRSVKICLFDIMPMRRPDDEMLRSLLMEVVNVVNSRPLTFIPLDNENNEALTPNHFLLGSSNGMKPPGNFESTGPILYSQWKEIQRLTDCFWKRFVSDYLPTLTRKTKWFQPVKPLDIGDIVLVIDQKNSRNIYPKAKVIDRVIGSNDQVRRVLIQFANGSVLWRGTANLARLDITSNGSLTVVPDSKTGGTVTNVE